MQAVPSACACARPGFRFSALVLMWVLAGCPGGGSGNPDGGLAGDGDGDGDWSGDGDGDGDGDWPGDGDGDGDVAVGDCSAEETLRYNGFLGLDRESQYFCHKLDAPPSGVFITEDFCFELNADGTGTIDWMGGYDVWGVIIEEGYQRSDSLEDFRWGAKVEATGAYAYDAAYGGIPIYWQNAQTGQTVDDQLPLLYWDDTAGAFKNEWPDTILAALPEEATSGGCMFLKETCITTATEKRCWSAGELHGAYERYDSNGRVEQSGTYAAGKKSGTWIDYTYDWEPTAVEPNGRTERDYEGASEDSYYHRKYIGDVLTEEGAYVLDPSGGYGHVQHGLWKKYNEPNESELGTAPDGVLREEGTWSYGSVTGLHTYYMPDFDLSRPQSAYGAEWDAYLLNRVATGTCVKSTHDYDTKTVVTYARINPNSACYATCDDPIARVITSVDGEASCAPQAGYPDACEGFNSGSGAVCQ